MRVLKNRPHRAAFTLIEVLVAAGVAAVGFLAVILLNTANLRYVKSSRQSNAATLCLQERAEQLRLADWRRLRALHISATPCWPLPPSRLPP